MRSFTNINYVLIKLIPQINVRRNDLILKVKVKLPLCFNWAPRHEGVLGEWMYGSIHSLTSALDWGEWSASRTGHFTPRERAPATHWIGGWMGPRAVLDDVVKRKIPSSRRETNPGNPVRPVRSLVSMLTEISRLFHGVC